MLIRLQGFETIGDNFMSHMIPNEILSGYFPTSSIDSVFSQIVNIISENWPEFLELDEESLSVKNFIQTYRLDATHLINYENQALAFNKAYFFKNLYKALIVLENFANNYRDNSFAVEDIGAGAGVFTIALYAIFGKPVYPVTLFDSSVSQLAIAKRIFQILQIENVNFKQGGFIPIPSLSPENLRLFSYWFCEQPDLICVSDIQYLKNVLGSSGIVIDYEEVISKLLLRIAGSYDTKISKVLVEVPYLHTRFFNKPNFTVNSIYYCNVK